MRQCPAGTNSFPRRLRLRWIAALQPLALLLPRGAAFLHLAEDGGDIGLWGLASRKPS